MNKVVKSMQEGAILFSEREIEAGFDCLQNIRFHQKRLPDIKNIDYWRQLNPQLTISSNPFAARFTPCEVNEGQLNSWHTRLEEEGYFVSPPLLPKEKFGPLIRGIERVVEEGYYSIFACVYDEFYQVYQTIDPILHKLLGPGYLMLPEGFCSFYIEPGVKPGGTGAGSGPHRDSLGPDPQLIATGQPALINVWIPLTDATLENSCMYFLPAGSDPFYLNRPKSHGIGDHVNLQAIHAEPAAAGSVLGWTTHTLHWGSRTTVRAEHPRISLACYFQKAEVPLFDDIAFEMRPETKISFNERLHWIARSINDPRLFDFPKECGKKDA